MQFIDHQFSNLVGSQATTWIQISKLDVHNFQQLTDQQAATTPSNRYGALQNPLFYTYEDNQHQVMKYAHLYVHVEEDHTRLKMVKSLISWLINKIADLEEKAATWVHEEVSDTSTNPSSSS